MICPWLHGEALADHVVCFAGPSSLCPHPACIWLIQAVCPLDQEMSTSLCSALHKRPHVGMGFRCNCNKQDKEMETGVSITPVQLRRGIVLSTQSKRGSCIPSISFKGGSGPPCWCTMIQGASYAIHWNRSVHIPHTGQCYPVCWAIWGGFMFFSTQPQSAP